LFLIPAFLVGASALTSTSSAQVLPGQSGIPGISGFEARSIDGRGNNRANPTWGTPGSNYLRVGRAAYADGRSTTQAGPDERFVSNRVFNDTDQTILSTRITQWGWVWGQALDHTFGLRANGTESDPIPFNQADPLEDFENNLGSLGFTRSGAAAGTGNSILNPRQQVNTLSSYIDASLVYGDTAARLEYLREGPVDGNLANNGPHLLLPGGFLPTAAARPGVPAPEMEIDGQLRLNPSRAQIAGDIRANENTGLQAYQTLFAREHNRVVDKLPANLTSEQKFQIARKVVGAEQQFITYNEFLPTLGVPIPAYTGYKSNVNAGIGNEFATVGFRAHSQVHAEFEVPVAPGRYTEAELAAFAAQNIEVIRENGVAVELVIPLNVASFNPDLLNKLGLGEFFGGFGEKQYSNDEMIDNQLRSVLFKVPGPNAPDPVACFETPATAEGCFQGVVDLGAIDVARQRDHGIPKYNDLRRTFGLPAVTSFTQITGESTESLPPGKTINSPDIMDFVSVQDANGNPLALGDPTAVKGTRVSTTAARLKAIYGNVNNIDGFAGMVAEKHIAGTEFGQLQQAMWRQQFTALRDGDRFFFQNDPALTAIKNQFGIDFKTTLGVLLARNVGIPEEVLAGVNLFGG
jgi:hypothetical protein